VDIEFEAPTGEFTLIKSEINEKLEPVDQFYYSCDPKDVNAVVGLAMAIDTLLLNMPVDATFNKLERSNAIIKQYAHQLQDNNGLAPDYVPNEIYTHIASALDIGYELVGLRWWQSAAKEGEDTSKAELLIAKWETRDKYKGGKYKSALKNKLQDAKMLTQMGQLKETLNKKMKMMSTEPGISDENKAKIKERLEGLIKRINDLQRR
jgi:hypothetical protein